ncbi:hypothetical protein HK097_008297, partial [Rhizophlyctis rosea]
MLAKLGYKAHVAKNGQEAVSLFKAHATYDLILMDMQMPVMDGLQATELIRNDPTIERQPVII